MAGHQWDRKTGQRYWVDDEGNATVAPETNLRVPFTDIEYNVDPMIEAAIINTGEKFHDFGRGIRALTADDGQRQALQQEGLESDAEMAALRGEYPISSMVGGAGLSLATAPISAAGLPASMALQAAIGGVEGMLDFDPSDSGQGDNVIENAGYGVLGEIGGRMAGRVFNAVKAFTGDALRVGRSEAANAAAQRFEGRGGTTLAHQRMEQGTRAQRLAERMAQGAESLVNPPMALREAAAANDQLFRDTAIRAVGLDPSKYKYMGPEFIDDANQAVTDGYQRIAGQASSAGVIQLSPRQAEILTGLGQIKDLRKVGDFAGLDDGLMTGDEWVAARQALSEDAASAFKNGKGKYGQRISEIVDDLDSQMAERLPEEFLPEFARLREQYRVLNILERPNVINANGEINVKTLNNALKSKNQGFARTATRAQNTVNTESKDLIDLMRDADHPEFKAFRSSGTAENQALRETVSGAGEAVTGLAAGNPAPALGWLGGLAAPGIIGASEKGSGAVFEALVNPAGPRAGALGGAVGRGFLDQNLYPFIGSEDDRPVQQ